MSRPDEKADLHRYLRTGREALLWKLEGLSEYDVRRPLTPTGSNLLGIVKHVATVEVGYLGACFGRPFAEPLPAWDEDAPNADMWATAQESRADVLAFQARAAAHADATVEALELDAVGRVPWWPADRAEVTLHRILVHLVAEVHRHAGHADVLRELLDGRAGLRADNANLPDADAAWWSGYRAQLEAVARQVASDAGEPAP